LRSKAAGHRLRAGKFDVKKALKLDAGILCENSGVYARNTSRSNDSDLMWHSRSLLSWTHLRGEKSLVRFCGEADRPVSR
jgi:hypothetical protein